MLSWTTSAPAPDDAKFVTPLDWRREIIAHRLAQSFDHQHDISVVNVRCVLQGEHLGAIAALVPEIAHHYGVLTRHQMKTVVFVGHSIGYYRTPRRGRGCRVKAAGAPTGWRAHSDHPHIIFVNEFEAGKFLKFGTTTLAIVIQYGGIFGSNPARVLDLGRALSTNRVESVLVITSDATSSGDVMFAHRYFKQFKKTIGYVDM